MSLDQNEHKPVNNSEKNGVQPGALSPVTVRVVVTTAAIDIAVAGPKWRPDAGACPNSRHARPIGHHPSHSSRQPRQSPGRGRLHYYLIHLVLGGGPSTSISAEAVAGAAGGGLAYTVRSRTTHPVRSSEAPVVIKTAFNMFLFITHKTRGPVGCIQSDGFGLLRFHASTGLDACQLRLLRFNCKCFTRNAINHRLSSTQRQRLSTANSVPEIVQYRVSRCALALRYGLRHVLLGCEHRRRQFEAAREICRHRRRICAARAVRLDAANKRRGQQQFISSIIEKIHGLFHLPKMAALHQYSAAKSLLQFTRCRPQIVQRPQFPACKHGRFVQVGHDERGQWQQFAHQDLDGIRLEQPGAAGGDHHRVHHKRYAPFLEKCGNHADDFRRMQHSRLHLRGPERVKDGLDLLSHHLRAAAFNRAHARRVLGGHTGDGRRSMHAEGGKGFQVRLQAGASAAVRAGDGQRDGNLPLMRHQASIGGAGAFVSPHETNFEP